MPYLPIAVLALAGLVLLGLALVRLVSGLGRVRAALAAAKTTFGDKTGFLRARSAAIGVALAERKRSAGRVPSTRRMQTGGRP
ncbi:hypothetical protein [Alloactinosynnema sp. L-07]|uniref:bacteriophage holin n=1 Tax=Alloactinosynnema sp. L-07 TaxID=1653480 RepID=UPI00065EF09E|nr:hypothetical protein [Alloactinosynnema sp. L-07]